MSVALSAGNLVLLNGDSAATSPAPLDSPATPVHSFHVDHVKIETGADVQDGQQPTLTIPIEPVKFEAASVVPEVGTPLDPDTIPIDPPHGTPPPPPGQLLPDVQMAESATEVGSVADTHMSDAKTEVGASPPVTPMTSFVAPHTNGHTNGHTHDADIAMSSSTADLAGEGSAGSLRRSADMMDDDDNEPPAKRARMHSAAPSLPHSTAPASPVVPLPERSSLTPSAAPATPLTHGGFDTGPPPAGDASPLTVAQHKFCLSTVRSLKKLKDAMPFLKPVDAVALNIPHYPTIIKHPMDFSTVERKLVASNPAKPDPNPENPRYASTDLFITDVRRIFSNALTFNGPDHVVTQMAKRVEAVFDKQLKQLPPSDEIVPSTPVISSKKGGSAARRPSTSVPAIRRDESNSRPKREIHAPPPRDLTYSDAPRRTRKPRASKNEKSSEQLRFCSRLLADLNKKPHENYAYPFYTPVDWQALNLPTYPKIVKKPMDMHTMRKKIDGGEYATAQDFHDDFKLMIRNCFKFNPPHTAVNQAGIDLQRVFDDKWKTLPGGSASDDEDDDEDDVADEVEDERARAIAEMESQMETMRRNLAALKGGPPPEVVKPKKEKKKAPKPPPTPVASSSKPKAPKPVAPSGKSSKKSKGKLEESDVLSFEQKKALSEAIGQLDGTKLEKVIQIIHEGVPEIRDSTEEIELEIDSLPAAVLTKLYNFVLKPPRNSAGAPKRSRGSKNVPTGGVNRKSMDEEAEAEKIRQLEERVAMFENGGHAPTPAAVASDSDSSSGSDDSDSDSE